MRRAVGVKWGLHLLTPKGPVDNPQHWQITCGIPGHGAGKACTKTRSCKFGGSEKVRLMLKWWAVLGKDAATATDHSQIWNDRVLPAYNIDALPSIEEVEALLEEG